MAAAVKRVLIVEDLPYVRKDLRDTFVGHTRTDGVFDFKIDARGSVEEAIALIRESVSDRRYDVLVLDLAFDSSGLDRKGLRLASALALLRRFGQAIPVVIVCSAYADLPTCVQAMRSGVWDVIHKRDSPDGRLVYELVVESAVMQLQAIDLQAHLNAVALEWVQHHIADLQVSHGGRIVAIWHEPEIHVVASGEDAFDLEMQLEAWRENRPEWMYPFVIGIPEVAAPAHAVGGWR